MKKKLDPAIVIANTIADFINAAFFGAFLSISVLFIMIDRKNVAFFESHWVHVLWLLPVVCGIVGIFCFKAVYTVACRLFNAVFNTELQ